MADALLDVLAARAGVVCAVGAGGKKSTLMRLAHAHVEAGTRGVALTATVKTARPPQSLGDARLIAPSEALVAQLPDVAAGAGLVIYAQPSASPGRLDGVPPATIAALHRRCRLQVTLVKADGARMRWIKAPAPGEPVLPPDVATVLPILSARAIDRPLDSTVAHRPERVAAITGVELGAPLVPEAVARLLASDAGALQGVGTATVVPIINMVDDDDLRRVAERVARLALGLTNRFDRVVLASMRAAVPVIAIVTR